MIFFLSTIPTVKPAISYSPLWYMPGISAVSPPINAQPDCTQPSEIPLTIASIFSGIDFAASQIIEEKQRLCALNDNIVHTHGNGVDPDRIMLIHGKSDFQLRAYAIRTRNEYRLLIFIFVQAEQPAEAPKIRQNFWTKCPSSRAFSSVRLLRCLPRYRRRLVYKLLTLVSTLLLICTYH